MFTLCESSAFMYVWGTHAYSTIVKVSLESVAEQCGMHFVHVCSAGSICLSVLS